VCVAHLEAFQSHTGSLLDLNIRAFQTLGVVNQSLEEEEEEEDTEMRS